MSRFQALADEIKALEAQGLIEIKDDQMTVLRNPFEVMNRIIKTGPWGALLLMGKLDETAEKIFGKHADG